MALREAGGSGPQLSGPGAEPHLDVLDLRLIPHRSEGETRERGSGRDLGAAPALVHIYQGPCGAISAAWFGLIVGALFLVTRRIWPLALAHGLGNFVAIGW